MDENEKIPSATKRVDELNALEESKAEELSGVSIMALETAEPKAKLLAALAYVHRKRTAPDLKWGDYLKAEGTKANVAYLFGSEAEDLEDAALDDGGEDDADPFPEGGGEDGAPETGGAPGDAEGSVLSRDGDQSG